MQNLPLRKRPIDIFFIVVFLTFALTSVISDALPTLGMEMTQNAPTLLGRANYNYGFDADPLFLHPPVWMRMVTGLSAFAYMPFYLVLAYALWKGKNWIQLPSVIYATAISVITGVVVFGVEFFGEPEFRTHNPVKFLSYNTPYVLLPILLLIRMRKPMPFTRKF